MESPTLKLVFNKGPRQGETLECRPPANVRIGRIKQGNTFQIKDAGISQKHLDIKFDGVQWTIFDLDSSNGTTVNGKMIPTMKSIGIRDGDTIKIGEETSMTVSIEKAEEKLMVEVSSSGIQRRRNPRRKAALKRPESVSNPVHVSKSPALLLRKPRAGRTKGVQRAAVILTADSEAGVRDSDYEGLTHASTVRIVEDKGGTAAPSELELYQINSPNDPYVEAAIQVDASTKGGEMLCPAHVAGVKVGEGNFTSVNIDLTERQQAAVVEEMGLTDLEQMTLGEWFDRMEKYLPRKINAVADAMIAKLRERQKQFEDFVLKQPEQNG